MQVTLKKLFATRILVKVIWKSRMFNRAGIEITVERNSLKPIIVHGAVCLNTLLLVRE